MDEKRVETGSSISGKKGSAFGRLMMRIYEVSGNKKDSSMEA